MLFSTEDRSLFLAEFGGDIPVKLAGVPVKTIRGISQYEIISDSADQAEIGSSVLTLQIVQAEYSSLDKTKKYSFTVDGVSYIARGPAVQDGAGFVKLQLKKG